jgi:uncharacterized membrane protein YfcA
MMPGLAAWQWAVAAFCGLLVGISKTGLPGAGTLMVPLFVMVLPARASTGALLPLLVLGDVFAVAWYRRHAVWTHLLRLLPLAAAGVVLGFLALGRISDRALRYLISGLVLALQVFSLWRGRRARSEPTGAAAFWLAAVLGLLAGIATMLANAASPIMLAYLLTMQLPKDPFLGTSAWFFLCINLFKVPFSAGLGLITPASLAFDLVLAPAVVAGAFLGVFLARRMPQRIFQILAQAFTATAALLLFL